MTPLTKPADLRGAFDILRAQLASGAVRFTRDVGWQGGGGKYELFWRDQDRYWALPNDSQEESRFWICVGLDDPRETNNLTITCEFNPTKNGIDRRTAGRFLRDADGRLYLAHSGKIGGGRPGIGKTAFMRWYRGAKFRLNWPDRVREEVVILGRLGDLELVSAIGEFTRAVAAFKQQVAG